MREFRPRRRPGGREDRRSTRAGSLTAMERASLRAVIREDRGSFLNPNKPARGGALVDVLDFCSRVESARAKEVRSVMLLSECELLDCNGRQKWYIRVVLFGSSESSRLKKDWERWYSRAFICINSFIMCHDIGR